MSQAKQSPSSTASANGTQPPAGGQAQQQPLPGMPTQSQQLILLLKQLGYTFKLNLCDDSIEISVQGGPFIALTDTLRAEIRTALRDHGIARLGAAEDAWVVAASQHAYHPVKDYLTSLIWDGQPHIAHLASYLQSSDPPVVYADGRRATLHHIYLHRWLIGAVAKVLAGEQNLMLVFVGAQGLGKSSLVKWLCSGAEQLWIAQSIDTRDKDDLIRIMTHLVWEVEELDASTRKNDVAALKAFITRPKVVVRKSYGRHDTVKPALASLFGTVNDGVGFLNDETGSRRFLVTTITSLNWAYQRLDPNQVWAEAVARYQAGESWRLLPEEETAQKHANADHEIENVVESYIQRHFAITRDASHFMTTAEIIQHLRDKDACRHMNERALAMDIARACVHMGLKRERHPKPSGPRGYVGIMPR